MNGDPESQGQLFPNWKNDSGQEGQQAAHQGQRRYRIGGSNPIGVLFCEGASIGESIKKTTKKKRGIIDS